MAGSKIENSQPGTDFESLYTNIITKLNEPKNTAFNVIPDDYKQRFLNFYKLPHNEQLELISDLSSLKNLPDEMKKAINHFPYLNTIPEDIFKAIGSYLKREDCPKEDKAISELVKTHKRIYTLFQPDRLSDLPLSLLWNVATGGQDKAEKIVDMHPELQLVRGTITDYSGRTFKDITAYEYAYWAKDTHMCRMLERYMNAETKAQMLKNCEDIEKHGLNYEQYGVEVQGSKHFDFTPLKKALQNYANGYDNWESRQDWPSMEEAWMEVGIAQCDVPVHVANEYCRKDRSFDPGPEFNKDKLPRVLKFYNFRTDKDELWFPLVISGSSGLGVDFGLVRGRRAGGAASVSGGWAAGGGERLRDWLASCVLADLAAVGHLDEVRTDDLTLSRKNLMLADPGLDNGFHCSL
jgi:hypothetical protein